MKILKITNRAQATCEGAFTYIPIDNGLSIEILYKIFSENQCEIEISKTVPVLRSQAMSVFGKVSFSTVLESKGFSTKEGQDSLKAEGQKLFENFLKSDEKLLHFDKELQKAMDLKVK